MFGRMRLFGRMTRQLVLGTAMVALATATAQAAPVSLGVADSFAVLADQTITNTGPTVVSGDIGVHPLTAITGFFGTIENDGPGTFTGAAHQGDAVAGQAQTDAGAAYVTLAGLAADATLAMELGGQLLVAGVYNLTSSAQLTGTLTLDGPGQYVFQIGTALTTASNSMVSLINGADACDVWFVVGSAATLGTDTDFHGNIIALTEAITLNTRATSDGRLISLGAAVNLDSNIVTVPFCPILGMPGVTVTDDDGDPVPDGSSATLINDTDFGTVSVNALANSTFTITNTGDSLLELGALNITGDFFLLGLFPTSILPGGSADFTIGMDTSTAGAKTGTASFTTNTPGSPFTFDLAGNVVIGEPGVIPEPSTMLLLAAGLGASAFFRRQRV